LTKNVFGLGVMLLILAKCWSQHSF